MLIDNAGSHPVDALLEEMERMLVIALPPNTTALLQPNDQGTILSLAAAALLSYLSYPHFVARVDAGIIRAYKAAYRREMLARLLLLYERTVEALKAAGKSIPPDLAQQLAKKFELSDAVVCLTLARNYLRVHPEIVRACWAHAGLNKEKANATVETRRAEERVRNKAMEDAAQVTVGIEVAPRPTPPSQASVAPALSPGVSEAVVRQIVDSEKELNESLERQLQDFVINVGIPESERIGAQAFVDMDKTVKAPPLNDDTIVEEVMHRFGDDDNDDATPADEVITVPDVPPVTFNDAIKAVNTALSWKNATEEMRATLYALKRDMTRHEARCANDRLRQPSVESMFAAAAKDKSADK
jgi:hypothetical protein